MDALLTIGLIGSFTAAAVAMHLRLTARPPEPVFVRPMDDIDAEFFRMINNERLQDIGAAPPELHAGVPADVRAVIWRGSPC